MEKYPHKTITYVVMFDGTLNVHLCGENLKVNYSKLTFLSVFENTVSLFLNYVSKIPVVNQIITAHISI